MTIWNTPTPSPRWALFLDVDGTLLDFEADPAAVAADASLRALLRDTRDALGGALALVSGRSLPSLDGVFGELRLPAAGLHGLERRRGDGTRSSAAPLALPERARARLQALRDRHPELQLEDKGASAAVHYRAAPRLEATVLNTVADLAADLGPDWRVQPGACVAELRPAARDKGDAVEEFMVEAPFAGRHPVYVGDDLTDLDAFARVERLGGDAIAVGERVRARWRLEGPAAVREWLAEVRDALAEREARA